MTGPRVVLVGPPGAGKTTIGRIVAAHTASPFIDTDATIEEQEMRSVAEIFVADGEPYFRAVEVRAVRSALTELDAVVALGGGAVLDEGTRTLLAGHRVVWLQVDVETAVRRVGMQAARPLLLGNVRSRMVTLHAEREPVYASVAAVAFRTDTASADEVADQIVHWLLAHEHTAGAES